MNLPTFVVLDSSRFPIIALERSRLAACGIEAMIRDVEALLSTEQFFVLSMAGERDAEPSHDDQKSWVIWLKENRDRMATTCRGVVSVRDTSSDPALQEKQAAGMQAMLGIPVKLANNVAEADTLAAALMN